MVAELVCHEFRIAGCAFPQIRIELPVSHPEPAAPMGFGRKPHLGLDALHGVRGSWLQGRSTTSKAFAMIAIKACSAEAYYRLRTNSVRKTRPLIPSWRQSISSALSVRRMALMTVPCFKV